MKRMSSDDFFLDEEIVDNKEIIGKVFGKWTVLSQVDDTYYFIARCDCGTEKKKSRFDLTCGKSSQCLSCYKKSKVYQSFRANTVRRKHE